ncbi:MAG: hypothetical protein B7C24_09795, partial [Bacteroidetes bacterium 4572_77]
MSKLYIAWTICYQCYSIAKRKRGFVIVCTSKKLNLATKNVYTIMKKYLFITIIFIFFAFKADKNKSIY